MRQKEYADFLYGYDETEGFSIVPKKKIEIPSTFYKYYALTNYNVEALTNLYVYASHPKQFNDPFDCNEKLIEFNTWDDIRNLWEDKFDIFRKTYPTIESACENSNKAYWYVLYKKLGLVSLSPVCDNYIMWALYAQNNGFCIEFDVDKMPFRHFGPFPINYVECVSEPVRIGDVGGDIAMLIQTNIKNNWWKHEEEWRLYIPNPIGFEMKCYGNEYEMSQYNHGDEHDRKFRYPYEVLRSITLGTRFFDKLSVSKLSSEETDIVCIPNTNSKELKVLDFLARLTEKLQIPIRLAILSDFNKYEFVSIRILKYAELKFRIIIVNE